MHIVHYREINKSAFGAVLRAGELGQCSFPQCSSREWRKSSSLRWTAAVNHSLWQNACSTGAGVMTCMKTGHFPFETMVLAWKSKQNVLIGPIQI